MDVPRLYALADTDRDGRISGREAVAFLQKSGLGNDVLGQVRLMRSWSSRARHMCAADEHAA
jgi:hypothetical protein